MDKYKCVPVSHNVNLYFYRFSSGLEKVLKKILIDNSQIILRFSSSLSITGSLISDAYLFINLDNIPLFKERTISRIFKSAAQKNIKIYFVLKEKNSTQITGLQQLSNKYKIQCKYLVNSSESDLRSLAVNLISQIIYNFKPPDLPVSKIESKSLYFHKIIILIIFISLCVAGVFFNLTYLTKNEPRSINYQKRVILEKYQNFLSKMLSLSGSRTVLYIIYKYPNINRLILVDYLIDPPAILAELDSPAIKLLPIGEKPIPVEIYPLVSRTTWKQLQFFWEPDLESNNQTVYQLLSTDLSRRPDYLVWLDNSVFDQRFSFTGVINQLFIQSAKSPEFISWLEKALSSGDLVVSPDYPQKDLPVLENSMVNFPAWSKNTSGIYLIQNALSQNAVGKNYSLLGRIDYISDAIPAKVDRIIYSSDHILTSVNINNHSFLGPFRRSLNTNKFQELLVIPDEKDLSKKNIHITYINKQP